MEYEISSINQTGLFFAEKFFGKCNKSQIPSSYTAEIRKNKMMSKDGKGKLFHFFANESRKLNSYVHRKIRSIDDMYAEDIVSDRYRV